VTREFGLWLGGRGSPRNPGRKWCREQWGVMGDTGVVRSLGRGEWLGGEGGGGWGGVGGGVAVGERGGGRRGGGAGEEGVGVWGCGGRGEVGGG